MEAKIDNTNIEQVTAYRMIEQTNSCFFIAGRAGTGKTTFLKNVLENINKRFVILAPTGQAAINAGGQTIHSFFGFNLGVLGPEEKGNINFSKVDIVRNLDTIIIDEVSMVRCDIIDAIDRTLRLHVGNSAPFGGIQMVFVGDMFQLEPIANKKDRDTLKQIYGHDSLYFYKASVLEHINLPKIEFLNIYRQNDPEFIELLEHVRVGELTTGDLMKINSRVSSDEDDEMRITLTSINADANRINEGRLAAIKSESKTYKAVHIGITKATSDIVVDSLVLKVGAQVMFNKNDRCKRWVNGTIGEVVELGEENVTVRLEKGEEHVVERDEWENIEYEYDHEKKCCIKSIVGKVIQLPLKLAWAITIHKSQSLTFDKVSIDFGNGAFSNGQAYVALSRARSLEGLKLLRPMHPSSVKVSRDVLDFTGNFNDIDAINKEISIGEAINVFEKNKDYDGVATTLYDMAKEEAKAGNGDRAYDYLTRAMAYIVDDECLKGKAWTYVNGSSKEYNVMNACGFYYSGDRKSAEEILMKINKVWLDTNLLGLYILARCLEDKGKWVEVEEVYNKMIVICASTINVGLDSVSFRKIKYRAAILNERQFDGPGLDMIRSLIDENPYYDKYHIALRWMLRKHPDVIEEYKAKKTNEEENLQGNELVKLLLDKHASDKEFLEKLRVERAESNDDWNEYIRFIKSLRL